MHHYLTSTLRYGTPSAVAHIQGSPAYPALNGIVLFYAVNNMVLVQAIIEGLPASEPICGNRFFGFHLHSGTACTGTNLTPFANAGGHYNPQDCPHPHHAGDFPPLPGCDGFAWMAFLTDRFQIPDILGRTVIIHENPDDFTSQPSGNAGAMIGCGVVRTEVPPPASVPAVPLR